MHVPYPLSSKGRLGYTAAELEGSLIPVHLFDCPPLEFDLYAQSDDCLDGRSQMQALQRAAGSLSLNIRDMIAQASALVREYHLTDYQQSNQGKSSATRFLATLKASDVSLWPDGTWSIVFRSAESSDCYLACFRPGAPAFTMMFEGDDV